MRIIDLTRIIETNMPVYPGSKRVVLVKEARLNDIGYNEIRMHISTHCGTHIDCGLHLLNKGFDTNTQDLTSFYGEGIVIDCRSFSETGIITKDYLHTSEHLLQSTEFLLLYTGWSEYWGLAEYLDHFPVLDQKAADYLVQFNLKGIGTDTISFDPLNDHKLRVHHILLSHGIVLIENLTNLGSLPASPFIFSCLPLKLKDGDGSPVRAVGIVTGD
jgi:arylformamidase